MASPQIDSLTQWLRDRVQASGTHGFVFGLSGGIDSAVVARLCQIATPNRVLGVILPCYSHAQDEADAKLLAKSFGIPTARIDLATTFDMLTGELHSAIKGLPQSVHVADIKQQLPEANIKPRLRMTSLYFVANSLNYLVAGTGNRSEITLGYYTKYGDGGCDVLPIGSLLKSEVRSLARELGVPAPIAVTLLMEAGLFVAVALAIGKLGTDVIAGHQIAINIASVAFMVPLGIAMATTVRVGHARGRGDAHGVRQAGAVGLILTLGVQLISATLLFTIPARIASMYTDDAAVIALAAQLLTLAAIFQLSDGIQAASNGALRGLKDTRLPMLITGFAYWGVGMPVGWWLAFPAELGARGMWMGLIAGLTVAAVLLTVRFWAIANRNAAAA